MWLAFVAFILIVLLQLTWVVYLHQLKKCAEKEETISSQPPEIQHLIGRMYKVNRFVRLYELSVDMMRSSVDHKGLVRLWLPISDVCHHARTLYEDFEKGSVRSLILNNTQLIVHNAIERPHAIQLMLTLDTGRHIIGLGMGLLGQLGNTHGPRYAEYLVVGFGPAVK